jgi:transposase InsO family protein
MEQRKEFIVEYLQKNEDFKSLCKKYEISEKTGHKWKNRFLEYGFTGLNDNSRKPNKSPGQLDEDTVIRLIKLRTAHPTWGPKKLAILYKKAYPNSKTPSESSIYRVLGKADLIKKRRIKKINTSTSRLRNKINPENPNDVWTVDFNGWWISNGEKCMPLTVRDLKSKYILTIRLMETTTAQQVKKVFQELFEQYGLPKVIRSDNGTPFASPNGLLGLTTLSAWWISLGIIPDRTDPGCPTQNGSHERMHADLSKEIQGKVPGGIKANQIVINEWVKEYNEIRPHEALDMRTPADIYCKSEIKYDELSCNCEYPFGFETKKIYKSGCIRIKKNFYYVSTVLNGFTIGLEEKNEGEYLLWLNNFPIGILDLKLACFKLENEVK